MLVCCYVNVTYNVSTLMNRVTTHLQVLYNLSYIILYHPSIFLSCLFTIVNGKSFKTYVYDG